MGEIINGPKAGGILLWREWAFIFKTFGTRSILKASSKRAGAGVIGENCVFIAREWTPVHWLRLIQAKAGSGIKAASY
jgi:hypothetical protein